jgi:hypothetical protein
MTVHTYSYALYCKTRYFQPQPPAPSGVLYAQSTFGPSAGSGIAHLFRYSVAADYAFLS